MRSTCPSAHVGRACTLFSNNNAMPHCTGFFLGWLGTSNVMQEQAEASEAAHRAHYDLSYGTVQPVFVHHCATPCISTCVSGHDRPQEECAMWSQSHPTIACNTTDTKWIAPPAVSVCYLAFVHALSPLFGTLANPLNCRAAGDTNTNNCVGNSMVPAASYENIAQSYENVATPGPSFAVRKTMLLQALHDLFGSWCMLSPFLPGPVAGFHTHALSCSHSDLHIQICSGKCRKPDMRIVSFLVRPLLCCSSTEQPQHRPTSMTPGNTRPGMNMPSSHGHSMKHMNAKPSVVPRSSIVGADNELATC